jgi:hypothetical protein
MVNALIIYANFRRMREMNESLKAIIKLLKQGTGSQFIH